MKKASFILIITLVSSISFGQVSTSFGVKAGLVKFTDLGINRVGSFIVDSRNSGSKFSYQLYSRISYNKFFIQPEIRYFSLPVYTSYENIYQDDVNWYEYRKIDVISFRDKVHRVDVPIKLGYFVSKNFSLGIGIVNSFNKYSFNNNYSFEGSPFLIKRNVSDSYKSFSFNGLLSVNFYLKRMNIGIDYDYPLMNLNSPVIIGNEQYPFFHKTGVYNFSVGYDILKK